MCYNCGCSLADDDMGHPDNITNKTFNNLSQKMGKDIIEVKKLVLDYVSGKNMSEDEKRLVDEMFEKASRAWGQSVDDAKKETAYMLKREIK